MKSFRLALTLLVAMAAILLAHGAERPVKSVSEASLRAMIVDNPDSVLVILDNMEKSKSPSLPGFRISLLRTLAYNEKRMYAYMSKYARETLSDDSIKTHPKEHVSALIVLSQARYFFGDLQGSIESSSEAMNIARATKNLPAELNVLTTMASTYFALGDNKKGYEVLERTVAKGSGSHDVKVLANVSSAYGVKIIQLYADGRFDEALHDSQKRLDIIADIDKLGGAPEGFTDQQRAYTYARIASCAQLAGMPEKAATAFDKFMNTEYGRSDIGKSFIVDYLLDARKYAMVIDFTRPLYVYFENTDTINVDYRSLLLTNAKAQDGLGNHHLGFELMQRANVIQDSLYMREKRTQAQELATVFALNEKQHELEMEKSESQKRLILLWLACGIIVLVILIFITLWWQYQTIKRHNHLAALRIDELMKQSENWQNSLTAGETDDEDKADFLRIEKTIVDGCLFKDPKFNRDSIVEATGLTRNAVIQLIQKYTGLTPSNYITKLRLEYSVNLIKNHPEWSIEGIAELCGYVRRATYYSHFNKFYGITPAQYRKELEKGNTNA